MIERTLTLRVDTERAWRAWTEKIDLWWPPGHRRFGDSTMRLEGRVGGRFVERARGGEELTFGRIKAWEPPSLLAYDFYPGSGPDAPTEVEVRFTATDGGTRVDIQHRRGALSEERWAGTNARYRASWDAVLPSLELHIERAEI
jgi:uncharacterized protein YndB with AHSA1/START domain